jgi:predicted AlkP superfamily pyrophosphatase or phosphodiesterase
MPALTRLTPACFLPVRLARARFPGLLSVAALFFAPLFAAVPALAAPVLMISIDGMKPEYVTQASQHGLKIPYLRSLMDQGAYADGVIGVWPTVTYPSHTTLITGVTPAEHGINNNLEFDPEMHFGGAWNWYASEIKAVTLWRSAHNAGLHVASVGWPVSVGTRDVDWLIPEYWRGDNYGFGVNPLDRELISTLSRPRTMMPDIEAAAGPYMMGNEATIAGDEIKTRYSLEILKRYKPNLMTVHISSLDEAEHDHGVFSAEANRTLEAIDGMISRLAQQAFDNDRNAVVLVVSDHGFMNITHWDNLAVPFVKAGLISVAVVNGRAVITAWKAQLWSAGGMVAVMLHDPKDQQTMQQVRVLVTKMAADPKSGIARVLERDSMNKFGCFPGAAFLIVLKRGYYSGAGLGGPMITPVAGMHGSHGYSPDFPEMRSSFFAVGAGIAKHRDLGLIDMRQIAPTAARILGVTLPAAKAPALHVQP